MNAINISNRKIKILYAIISNYIKTGEPISSKNLCNLLDFSVSSATIRNEMSELTELGFLEQPHTSAARVPSFYGYKFYINELMPKKNISPKFRISVDEALNIKLKLSTPEEILKSASNLLAKLTNLTVISTIYANKNSIIKNIQLVKTSKTSIMLILSTSNGLVKTKIFKCEYEINSKILILLYNHLNEKFLGIKLSDITPGFIQSVAASLGELYLLIPNALLAILEIAKESLKNDIYIAGQANLLLIPDVSYNILKVFNLLNCSDYAENLLLNVDSGTTISIGRDNIYEELFNMSIIKTTCCFNNEILGSIGIIAPVRVDYSNLIAEIEYIASTVSNLLGNILDL